MELNNKIETDNSQPIVSGFLPNSFVSEIDLSQPQNLYLTEEQARSFEAATVNDSEYQAHINQPIDRLLRENRESIFNDISQDACFIDLGPGHPSKSLALIRYLKGIRKHLSYVAVDVSAYFLRKSVELIQDEGIPSRTIQSSFENFASIVDDICDPAKSRIVFLGLTFCNFEIDYICKILSSLLRRGDICLVCSQSTLINNDELLAPYKTASVGKFSFGHLKSLGFSRQDFSYEPRLVDKCIQTTFVCNRDISFPLPVRCGTRIVTAKSFRNGPQFIEMEINKKLKHVKTYTDSHNLSLIHISGRG